MPIDALSILCAQLTRNLLAIAKFLFTWSYSTCKFLPVYQISTSSWISFQDKDSVPINLIWGLLPPAITRTLKLLRVLHVLGKVKQCAKFQHRISMHHAVMQICFCHRLSIVCAEKWFFGGSEGKGLKILCSNPKKHYPAWIRIWWCILCQNRFNDLSSRSVQRFCVQINFFKWVASLAIWG